MSNSIASKKAVSVEIFQLLNIKIYISLFFQPTIDHKHKPTWSGQLSQSSSAAGTNAPNTSFIKSSNDTFEQFRKQAKEKENREKQLKEQIRKQSRLDKHHKEDDNKMMALMDKQRKPYELAAQDKSSADTNSISSGMNNSLNNREFQRQQEQERRRRQAVSVVIRIV